MFEVPLNSAGLPVTKLVDRIIEESGTLPEGWKISINTVSFGKTVKFDFTLPSGAGGEYKIGLKKKVAKVELFLKPGNSISPEYCPILDGFFKKILA